jgi:hypothetical protein
LIGPVHQDDVGGHACILLSPALAESGSYLST